MSSEITLSMHEVVMRLTRETPGVLGALVASADGFALASDVPEGLDVDGLAAMSAATLALSHQLAAVNGPAAASVSHHVSNDGQVMIVPVAHVAAVTLLSTPTAEASTLARAGHKAAHTLQRLLRGTATV